MGIDSGGRVLNNLGYFVDENSGCLFHLKFIIIIKIYGKCPCPYESYLIEINPINL